MSLNRLSLLWSLCLLLVFQGARAQNVVINELMARNANGIKDEFGDDDDWIEIYNPGSNPVNLAGYYVSDTNNLEDYYRIPQSNAAKTTVPAGGYLILWADGEPAEGPNHLPFKLNNGGEAVFLGTFSNGSVSVVSQVVFPKLERDVSYGRYPNGTGAYRLLSDPTPGAANLPIRVIPGVLINEIMAVNNGPDRDEDGEAEDWIELYNPTSQPVDVGGLYLTDSIGELTMHRIPIHQPDSTTIPPGGFLRLWVDGEPRTSVWHVDFRLGRSGEKITMTQPDGLTIMQEISYPALQPDATFGQYPDGSGNWIYLNQPSPNAPNSYTWQTKQGVLINEFLAINESGVRDNLGELEDWIELYNPTQNAVDVGGLIFSDDPDRPFGYRIPETQPDSTTIPPGGHLVFWADNQPEQGVLHLDLKLDGAGEAVGLYQYRNALITLDEYEFGLQTADISTGRSPDGANNWVTFSQPTPGRANTGGSSILISGLYINEFVARNTSGYTDEFGNMVDWIELFNDTNEPINIGGLYFTDDLSNPQMSRIPDDNPGETTVPPKGYLIVWPDVRTDLGPRHLDFQLAGAGEDIGIYQYYNGEKHAVQEVTYPAQTANVSYGRAPDASPYWHFFASPTPMAPNPATGVSLLNRADEKAWVHPNPVSFGESLFIGFKGTGEYRMQIYSSFGQLMNSITVTAEPGSGILRELKLPEAGIHAAGIYVVVLEREQSRSAFRLVVY